MASLKRSKDHSLWIRHIDDPGGDVVTRLKALKAGQSVVLNIGGNEGVWVRFVQDSRGRAAEALKCGDKAARSIWDVLPADGTAVSIHIVHVVPCSQSNAAPVALPLAFQSAGGGILGDVWCLGVDVAWCGGQRGTSRTKRESRSECLASIERKNGEWGPLRIRRVDLNDSYNHNADAYTANSDPQAATLLAAIGDVLPTDVRVVAALDVPLMEKGRGLQPPKKANDRGETGGVYRECDECWMRSKQKSASGWRTINVLPGAPIYPRVASLLAGLIDQQFRVYGECDVEQAKRIAVECFPNEVVWSCGVLGLVPNLTCDGLQLYKRLGKKNIPLPCDVFKGIWCHTLGAAWRAAGMNVEAVEGIKNNFEQFLVEDGVVQPGVGVGRTGKRFDDAVDSVLALSVAVAFALGNAHVHQGDPQDGHIIGPGMPSSNSTQNGR